MKGFGLDEGTMIGDKAFPSEGTKTENGFGRKVGYIHPCKRSSKAAKELGLYAGIGSDGKRSPCSKGSGTSWISRRRESMTAGRLWVPYS